MKKVTQDFKFLFEDVPIAGKSGQMRMNLHDRGDYLEQGILRDDFELLLQEEFPELAEMDLDDPEMEELYGLVQLGWARALANYAMARYKPKEGKLLFNNEKAFRTAVIAKLKSLMVRAAEEQE